MLYNDDDDNDDDDDDDDDKLFCRMVDQRRPAKPYLHSKPLSQVLITVNWQNAKVSMILTCKNERCDFAEWNCAVMITTARWCHSVFFPKRQKNNFLESKPQKGSEFFKSLF